MGKSSSLGEISENYRGVDIRQYPQVTLRLSVPDMRKIVDAKLDYGMSAMEAIKNKKVLCKKCDEPQILKYNPNAKSY